MVHIIQSKDLYSDQSITLASSSNANGAFKQLRLITSITVSNLHSYYQVTSKTKNNTTPHYSGVDLDKAVAEYNDIQC